MTWKNGEIVARSSLGRYQYCEFFVERNRSDRVHFYKQIHKNDSLNIFLNELKNLIVSSNRHLFAMISFFEFAIYYIYLLYKIINYIYCEKYKKFKALY